VLTQDDGNPITAVGAKHFDELVVGQEAQILPLYVIEFDPAPLGAIASRFTSRSVLVPKGERRKEEEESLVELDSSEVDDKSGFELKMASLSKSAGGDMYVKY